MADKWQNRGKEEGHDKGRDKKGRARLGKVAKKPRGYKHAEEGISRKDSGLGGDIHGIREGAGEYDPAEGTPRKGKDSTRPVDSTRYFETAQGRKSYSEVAEIIAVSVTKSIESLVEQSPKTSTLLPSGLFKIEGNARADKCYTWSSAVEGSTTRRYYAVLHVPIDSPEKAVRASLVVDFTEEK